MSGKNQHVVPHSEGWAVKGAGNQKATAVYETQYEAISHARSIAMNRERNSYGNDPYPPRG